MEERSDPAGDPPNEQDPTAEPAIPVLDFQDLPVLVTGGGGFLGRYIVEQLLGGGAQVRSLSRNHYPALSDLGVEQHQADVRDTAAVDQACRGQKIVFHVAAVAGIWGPWKHYYGINTLGTRHVLNACRRNGVKRLVYTSSPSVTFGSHDQCGIDETAPYPTRWLCHYPHTKALAEQLVLSAHGDSLATCALRPHLIWGPRDDHLIPRLLARARSGALRRVGDGTNLVDMVYVENAAYAHLLAAQALQASRGGGQAFFISQGEPVNCWDWINEILELADLPPIKRGVSYSMAWRVGAALEFVYRLARIRREPRMTRFLAAQLAKSHYFSLQRARQELDYEPVIPATEGMRRVGRWLDQTEG